METQTSTIAKLNDTFRRSFQNTVITPEVLVMEDLLGLTKWVADFNDFNEDNDPYSEHDFGSFDWYGEKIFWKIDYYDKSLTHGEDPLSPSCRRVMTVMLASEY